MSFINRETVDSKVVEMSLDNREFEKNATSSISTISKLKQALDFSDAGKGFDDISKSMKGIDVGGLTRGIETLSGGFSAMEAIAFGALSNIGAKIADVTMKVGKMFVIDPVSDGFSEYQLKMGSVQTIMASTGETLDSVNKYLEELNLYADKTIYSFSDMTNSIGKFTNAGVKLEDAVAAIQGISNEAAVSGANAQQASHAMYNFAQALSSGYVKLIDWKSIENANMATVEFKEQLLQTAVEMGTLAKQADGTYKVLTHGSGSKGMKETISATKNFNDSLQQQWMTTDVLTKTLAKYADETTDIGKKAFAAATEVKTFSQLMDTLKEAAGSGWAQTFELIVGDFDQAKELFTFLSNKLGGVIDGFSKSRNEFLKAAMGAPESYVTADDWKNLGLTDKQAQSLTKSLIELGKASGIKFGGDTVDDLVDSLSQGWLTAGKLKEALNFGTVDTSENVKSLDAIHDAALRVIRGDFGNDMTERFRLLEEEGFDAELVQEYVNNLKKLSNGTWNLTEEMWKETDATLASKAALTSKTDEELKALGWTDKEIKRLRKLQKQAEETGTPINELIEKLEKPQKSGRENLFETIKNIFSGVGRMVTMVKAAWSSIFPKASADAFRNLTEKINLLSQSFKKFAINNGMKIYKFFRGLFSVLDIGVRIVKELAIAGFNALKGALGGLGIDVMGIAANIGDLLYQFRNWIVDNELIQKGVALLGKIIGGTIGAVKGFIDTFLNLPIVSNNIKRFQTAFKSFGVQLGPYLEGGKQRITDFIQRVKDMGGIRLDNVADIFNDFKTNVLGYFVNFPGFKSIKAAIDLLVSDIKVAIKNVGKNFKQFLYDLRGKVDGTIFADILDFIFDWANKLEAFFHDLPGRIDFSIGGIFDLIKSIIGGLIDLIANIKWGKVLKIGVGVTAVLGIFGALKKVFGLLKSGKNFLSGITDAVSSFADVNKAKALKTKSEALRNLALSIGILVASIYVLTTLDPKKLWMSVGVLAVLSAMMLGVIFAMNKIGKGKGPSIKASIALIAVATSVAILVAALKMLDDVGDEHIVRNLLILAGMLTAMVAVCVILSKYAPKLASGGIGLILFVVSLKMLVGVLKKIDELDLKNPLRTVGILTALMLGLAVAAAIAKKSGLRGGLGILLAAAGILVLVQAVEQLGKIKKNKLKNGLVAVTVLGLLIMGIMTVIGLIPSSSVKLLAGAAGILIVAMGISVLALALRALSTADPAKLAAATLCLSLLIGMMGVVMAVTSVFKSIPVGLVVMVAVVGLLALILGLMSHFKVENALANAAALSLLLLSMSASMALLTVAGAAAPAAITGILLMVGMIALFGLLAVGIGALITKFPQIETWIDKGIPMLEKLAAGIGRIVQAFLGGISAAVMDTLMLIPRFLKAFLNGMRDATAGGGFNFGPVLESVGAILLVSIVGFISAVLSAASEFLTGKSAVEQFGDDLRTLADALNYWDTVMEEIDGIDIPFGAISELALIIAGISFLGLFEAVSDCVTELLTGQTPMENFSYNLGLLGSALVDWQTKMEGYEDITIPSGAIDELAEIIADLSFQGLISSIESILNLIATGRSNVEQFAIDVGALAGSLVTWQSAMETIDGVDIPEEGINDLVDVIDKISFAGFLNSVGSILTEVFESRSAAEQFSTDVSALADALVTWNTQTSRLGGITVDTEGIQNLIDAVDLIPTQSLSETIKAKFSGKSDAEKFGEDVGILATAVNSYVTNLNGVDISGANVEASTNLIDLLATLAGDLPEQSFIDWLVGKDTPLAEFAAALPQLGTALSSYAKNLSDDITSDKVTAGTNAALLLASLGDTLKDQNLGSSFLWMKEPSDFEKFGDNLVYLATGLNGFVTGIENIGDLHSATMSTARLVNAGNMLADLDLTTGDIAYDARVIMIKTNVGRLLAMISEIEGTNFSYVDTFVESIDKITAIDFGEAAKKLGGGSDIGKDTGGAIATSVSDGITAGNGEVAASASSVTDTIVDTLVDSDSSFISQGTNLIKSLASGFKSAEAGAELVSALSTVVDNCTIYLSNKGGEFSSTATGLAIDFANGFSNGLNSFHARLVVMGAAYAIGRVAIDSLKKAIDAHSPSKEGEEIGGFLDAGFINGMMKYSEDVYDSAYGVGTSAREGLANATKAMSGLLESGLDDGPVIRPVLDLTEIQNGSAAIGDILNRQGMIPIQSNLSAINTNTNNRNTASNADIVTALGELGALLGSRPTQSNNYNINGITYDDGSNVSEAVRSLIRAARIERRV